MTATATPAISETRRADRFCNRPVTRIWQETPSPENPYVAEGARCHGYDLLELLEKARFCEVLFLLFRGELPTAPEAELLEKWLIASINPGPRHPATRAALNAGIGKTNAANILPVALTVLGGDHLGATEVKRSMRYLAKHVAEDPGATARHLLEREVRPPQGDWHVVAGFGSRFGGIDHLSRRIGELLAGLAGAGPALRWAGAFAAALEPQSLSWLDPGIAAAVALDLGFNEYAAMGLFQVARAPGLLAHGVEMVGQPLTAMPFLGDESYVHE
jgi:citrate synthase